MQTTALKELAYRRQNGLEVSLLWDPCTNDVCVAVTDHVDGTAFRVPVAGHEALDAFHHPYAYGGASSSPTAEIEGQDWGRPCRERGGGDG